MITAEDPFLTWYFSRFGATSVQRVKSDCPGPDASQSRTATLRNARNSRVARATIGDASAGGHSRGIGTRHVVVPLPRFTATSTTFGGEADFTLAS
jgi:hypothetical protein